FDHAPEFDRPTLRAHAQTLGLDVDGFLEAIDTGTFASTRIRHRRQAKRLGIVGLPAAFINGRFMTGYAEEAAGHAIVDQEIEHAKQLVAAGVPRSSLYAHLMKDASSSRVAVPKAEALEKDLARRKAETDPSQVQVIAPKPDQRY